MNERPNGTKSAFAAAASAVGRWFAAAAQWVGRFFVRYWFFIKKILIAIVTIACSTIIIFFILRLIPGDVVREYALSIAQRRGISYDAAYEIAVNLLNYDPEAPIFTQFFKYVGGLFQGNLGASMYVDGVTANSLIAQRLTWTLLITSVALIISFLLGTAIGAFMARKRRGVANVLLNGYIVTSGSIPDYLLGLLLVLLFAYTLPIFPAQGNYDISVCTPGFNLPFIGSVLYHACLPILAYVLSQTGSWALMMRGSAIGVLGEDYINAARARGIGNMTINRKYLKRNAMLPLVTSFAVTFAALFGGSTLMESIFNYPGIGLELAQRIGQKDYFVVQGIMFFSSFMVIAINLITDCIYSLIDPRIRETNK